MSNSEFRDWRQDITEQLAREHSKMTPADRLGREVLFWVGLLIFLSVLWGLVGPWVIPSS
jgi:type II secretory pathway component PulM